MGLLNDYVKIVRNRQGIDVVKQQLIHANKNGYTSLILTCRWGNIYVMNYLIHLTKDLYQNDAMNLNEIADFLNHETEDKFTACITTLKESHDLEIALALFEFIRFVYKNNIKEAKICLEHKNQWGYTALNAGTAVKEDEKKEQIRTKMIEELIKFAEEVYKDDNEGFRIFLTNDNSDKFPPLISAAIQGLYKRVRLLVRTYENKFGDDGFDDFINHQNKYECSALRAAMIENQYETATVLKELIDGHKIKFSRQFIPAIPLQKISFSPTLPWHQLTFFKWKEEPLFQEKNNVSIKVNSKIF